jgi:hypothetical protein
MNRLTKQNESLKFFDIANKRKGKKERDIIATSHTIEKEGSISCITVEASAGSPRSGCDSYI